MADSDYLIEKGERDGRTVTRIRKLSEEERAYEIARINVGENVTPLALDSARQMLAACRETKEQFIKTNSLISQ